METLKNKMQTLKDEADNLHQGLDEKNTSLKLMIEEREHSEAELASIRRQLKLAESNLERIENVYNSNQKVLHETLTSAEDCDKLNFTLTEKADSSNDRLEQLQAELKETNECEVNSEMRSHEISKTLTNVETEYEKVDKKATEYEKKIADLEREMSTVNSTLHSLENSGAKLNEREEEHESVLKDLLTTLEEIEEKRSSSERSSQKLKRDIDIAEDTLRSWKEKTSQIKRDIDSMVADINSI